MLSGARWECGCTPPGAVEGPAGLGAVERWWPARVPGTAAGALADAGSPDADYRDYDADDWWFRTSVVTGPGRWELEANGLATVGEVWIDGRRLLRGDNMFRRWSAEVDLDAGPHELVVRCQALEPLLALRRPRPRWKTYLVAHQNLRWFRTSLLGRVPGWASVPAPVGPWRPLTLRPVADVAPRLVHLAATCEGDGGVVDVELRLPAGSPLDSADAVVRVAGSCAVLGRQGDEDGVLLSGRVELHRVERWWPHTHGAQTLYEVVVELSGRELVLGRVGFRTVEVQRGDGGFGLLVNGVPIFCRGACWFPPDPVRPQQDPALTRSTLDLARRANCNMVRVPGTAVYEDATFLDRCDELGILVWHDAMLAFADPPDDAEFLDNLGAELSDAFATMAGRPSVVVICGSQEVEEVAAMTGLPAAKRVVDLIDKEIPRLVERLLPGVVYVTSNPTGGALPFQMDAGVCQYFGVGGYLRSLDDPRRAGVRFAAECLALATPPERSSVEHHWGGATPAGHDPAWKRGLHHDAGRSWDMEDVRDHYVRSLFGVDPLRLRYEDPERALDLGRATNAHLMESVFSEWRRPGSSCDGGLVLALRDLRPGAGWGLVDVGGQPKAPWYALRRIWAPLALLLTDEGLNGLHCHVLNDSGAPFAGTLRVELVAQGELYVDEGELPVDVAPRSGATLDAGSALEGFRDITYSYRFAPPAHDAVVLTLLDASREEVARAVHLNLGQDRPLEHDVGLSAQARPGRSGVAELQLSTRRLAQWVCIEAPGFVPGDSWFHLPPGRSRTVELWPSEDGAVGRCPRGVVRALNSANAGRIVPEDAG